MNFIALESARKLRGGFYTQPGIASFLAQWVMERKPRSLLEPSCGDGAFLQAARQRQDGGLAMRTVACEIDPDEAAKARRRVPARRGSEVQIHTMDFLDWFLSQGKKHERFDAVLGNPPFIRYQYLPEQQQLLAQKIITRFGLPFTKHTNAWVPFLVASLDLLAPGGRLGMVIPSELFHIPHAESARRFLAAHCARALILDPEELWFDGALQGVVLLLAEKTAPSGPRQGLAVHVVRKEDLLREPAARFFDKAGFALPPEGKWMRQFLSKREHSLLEALESDPRFARFERLADVDVGIVTGANRFFLVPDDVVEQFKLHPWAHAMIGRSEHMPGVIYTRSDQTRNATARVPTNFLWFNEPDRSRYPDSVLEYLRQGEAQAIHSRYKCRVREPWFRVPSVYAAPVCMVKRAHHFPRLILNQAKVFTTDTVYRIQPRRRSASDLVYSSVNSLTALSAELEGRHYGGGVLELVPSEIERLLLPLSSAAPTELTRLDARIRVCEPPQDILQAQDRRLLAPCGLSVPDQQLLSSAWNRLRQRRQRASI